MGHHLLSMSRHPASCSGLALVLPGRGVGRAVPGPWVHHSSVCCKHLCLLQPAHGCTETQLQPCLPSQHVLRYKYFYSFFFGYLSSAFWVQWEFYSVMFGSSWIFWGWCHEKQDAQVLPCLNNPSRFYCHTPHHEMWVLPKPSTCWK